MSFDDIAAILAVDGIAAGAIYVLVAIGLVLIFTVTRVIFVPFGDIAAFAALTLAALNDKHMPGTAGLVAGLAVAATLMEAYSLYARGAPNIFGGRLSGICWRRWRSSP
jgi:branched-chain amino acid transport system permease protein